MEGQGVHLILVRHGQSVWNSKNLFTGWVDVPLSCQGIAEAESLRPYLARFSIGTVFCSTLIRAIMTAMIALADGATSPVLLPRSEKGAQWAQIHSPEVQDAILPVICDEALNERMYGSLQGMNKQEAASRFGQEVVQSWRRGVYNCPPNGESLSMTMQRVLPYFNTVIVPTLARGITVLVVAHGNSLRAIIKHIEALDDQAIMTRELATGVPLLYRYETGVYTRISAEKEV